MVLELRSEVVRLGGQVMGPEGAVQGEDGWPDGIPEGNYPVPAQRPQSSRAEKIPDLAEEDTGPFPFPRRKRASVASSSITTSTQLAPSTASVSPADDQNLVREQSDPSINKLPTSSSSVVVPSYAPITPRFGQRIGLGIPVPVPSVSPTLFLSPNSPTLPTSQDSLSSSEVSLSLKLATPPVSPTAQPHITGLVPKSGDDSDTTMKDASPPLKDASSPHEPSSCSPHRPTSIRLMTETGPTMSSLRNPRTSRNPAPDYGRILPRKKNGKRADGDGSGGEGPVKKKRRKGG